MRQGKIIKVIIPAFNEEMAIGKVIASVPQWVDEVIVADNQSTDRTAEIADRSGATVVAVTTPGAYGAACLDGIAALGEVDVVVFLDGDFSDHAERMDKLVDPVLEGSAGLVLGSRKLGKCETGALTPQQIFGNWLACFLIRLFWGMRYSDLGPFRAVSAEALKQMGMDDRAYGWTVQMQLRAIEHDIRVLEVPVDYRARTGKSKISGTIKGTILAGYAILGMILKSKISQYLSINGIILPPGDAGSPAAFAAGWHDRKQPGKQ